MYQSKKLRGEKLLKSFSDVLSSSKCVVLHLAGYVEMAYPRKQLDAPCKQCISEYTSLDP